MPTFLHQVAGFHCAFRRGTRLIMTASLPSTIFTTTRSKPGPIPIPAATGSVISSLRMSGRVGRVLAYGYDSSASALFADDAPKIIQRMAESFVQELRADRQFACTLRRPIIFVCHGMGGVLVKKSLVYQSSISGTTTFQALPSSSLGHRMGTPIRPVGWSVKPCPRRQDAARVPTSNP